MKYLRLLLGLCDHKWRTIKTVEVYMESPYEITGTKYHLECEKCGNVKSKTL